MPSKDQTLRILINYTKKGWALLPLKPGTKVPLISGGHNSASNDPKVIRKWFNQNPKANWGVATGKVSGIVVIDIDVKGDKEGLANWEKLKQAFPKAFPTLKCKTPSGGAHYYYQYPSQGTVRCQIGYMDGIDIKGDGGYVVLAPSKLNQTYVWRNDHNIAVLPKSLNIALKYGAKILPPVNIHEGSRNEQLFKYAGVLRDNYVQYKDAEELIETAADLTSPKFSVIEAINSLKSAYKYNNSASIIGSAVLKSISLEDFMKQELAPIEWLAHPLIPKPGLSMIYAQAGVGKTWLAMEISYAIACGIPCFEGKFQIERPSRVLYIDGEMTASSMQERFKEISTRYQGRKPKNSHFRIVTPDLQNGCLPDIATELGQVAIENILDDAELLIIDNLSCLCLSGKENEAESWIPIQQWALKLKRLGVSVIFIHHAGKNGSARGTSKRSGVLDSVIKLSRPGDYKGSQGARYIVEYEKSRAVHGDAINEFEIWLKNEKDWNITEVKSDEDENLKIIELHKRGLTLRDIEEHVDCKKTKIGEVIRKWQEENLEESD